MSFRALVTDEDAEGRVTSSVAVLDDSRLPEGEVSVDVEWAGLNYKDGLCLTGAGGLVRNYPHVAGIDFAGTVRESADGRYRPGDKVVLTGWRVGETHWGGYAERARVKADWLIPLPGGLSTRDAMIVGTAGLTAMLCVMRLEAAGVAPEGGEVLVTGAAGGVGSIAVALLARAGFQVAAFSGRPEHGETLRGLGAGSIVEREQFMAEPDKVLESARWAGGIDTVGGKVLGKLLKQIKYGGAVAAIGNAAGIELNTNVLPFILRGVSLLGVDSVMQPYAERVTAWSRISEQFDLAGYSPLVDEVGLERLPAAAEQILAGQVRGRILVNPRA
jgi:acrylyl-CoA reductase (NADPH)